jgi:outer membrane protein OmpA-like peptidoglycan-associated protein
VDKKHDFIPRFHNIIFLMDVSDSMTRGYPQGFDHSRLYVATRALFRFNRSMPPVPRWQYDLNSALITFGDSEQPTLVGSLSPWGRGKYDKVYKRIRQENWGPWKMATLQEALQLAGSMACKASGKTAIVIFTDGGSNGESPQATAVALKEKYGDDLFIYGVFFGDREVGWRNIYETCKLTGGYVRAWEEVRVEKTMKDFSWDILVREIMFPYPEIFFKAESAELLPSEALKLQMVANFMHAIPQYVLQIDGHTTFIGDPEENYGLGMQRANVVKKALVSMYKIDPRRVLVRSWGDELPYYDNQNPEIRLRNRRADLYLMLPLRNFPYNEKNLNTHGVKAVGDLYITQERESDTEWAWPATPPPGSARPPVGKAR